MSTKEISRLRGGFTLLELVVALGIFIIITTIAVGGFVGALRTQRQVAALISANNNVSLVIEQMAREMRTGRNFYLAPDGSPYNPPSSLTTLSFYNGYGELVTYRKNPSNTFIERRGSAGGNFERITGLGAFVWNLTFLTNYYPKNDNWPTRVTILVGVSATESGIAEGIVRLHTTVSSRQADE